MSLIVDSKETIIDASYRDSSLPVMPTNITYDVSSKLFTDKDGNTISNEQINSMYKGYLIIGKGASASDLPEGNIQELLPDYDPEKDMHRNDSRNLTELMKRYALLFEASRGKDTQAVMEGISARLEDLGLPGIGNQFDDNNSVVAAFKLDKQHLVDVESFTFGFTGSRPDQRISASEFLYDIMSDLAKDGVAAEEIASRAHVIFQSYLTMAAGSPDMKL